MATNTPKIALVYHEAGDPKRIQFLTKFEELISLVEPKMTTEIFPALRLLVEDKKHSVAKVVVFLFDRDTDFPSFPVDMSQYFNVPSNNDILVVTARPTKGETPFNTDNILQIKDVYDYTSDWCPKVLQKLFPIQQVSDGSRSEVILVCDETSKPSVKWCQSFVGKLKDVGGNALYPGTPEWTSVEDIISSIKPTSLVVIVPMKGGLEFMVKYGNLIGVAKEKAKVIIATKSANDVTSELKGKGVNIYSMTQPVDLWLEILSHQGLVSCKMQIPAERQGDSTGYIMPFAKTSQKVDDGLPTWAIVLMVILGIILIPVFIVLCVIWVCLGKFAHLPSSQANGDIYDVTYTETT